MGELEGDAPPAAWPRVLRQWFEASRNRDPAQWRACLQDDVQSIAPDGSVTDGAEAVVAGLGSYYSGLNPTEVIDRWIEATTPSVFAWHGRIEPGSDHETSFCTVCTLGDDRIAELRFFSDPAPLARLWSEGPPQQAAIEVVASMGAAELTSSDELRNVLHPEFQCWLGAAREPLDRDGYIESLAAMRQGFPDVTYEVPAPPIGQGNRVATTFRVTGTHSGSYLGLDPTGSRIDIGGLSMFEVEDGRVRRMWSALDSLAMASQLGMS